MAFTNEYTVNVDIKRSMSNIVPTFKQGENAVLRFKVFNNNKLYDLTDFVRAEIVFRLPSGESILGQATLANDGLIEYFFTGVEMSQVGRVQTTLSIYSGTEFVGIQPFVIHIYDSMKNQDLSYIGILQDLIAEVKNLEMEINESLVGIDEKVALLDEAVLKEEIRETNETQRISNENNRISNEADRTNAESLRISNETSRKTDEDTRISNEDARKIAESARVSSEANRQATFNNKITEVDTTITEANQVITEAQSAVSLATNDVTTAIANVNIAKINAETATLNAKNATDSVNQVKTDTLLTKEATEQATLDANTATVNAITATNEANLAKNDTLTAIANAETATTNAITATSAAQLIANNTVSTGTFTLGQAYKKNNLVLSNGSTFIALVDTQLNPLPTLPVTENTWWRLVAQRGTDGEGSVSSINGIFPDVDGNVTLDLGDAITMVDGFAPDAIGNVITHTNKAVLDGLTDDAGQLKYKNQVVGSVTSVNGSIGAITGLETVANSDSKLSNKVDKVSGKGLSTNDYTTAEKNKLNAIESGAQVNKVTSVNGQIGDVTIQGFSGSYNDLINKPTTFNPSTHSHPISQVTGLQTELDRKYVKPSTGVPLTDLNSSVQTSLNKAETALQSVPDASTTTKGIVQLEDSLTSTSTTSALSANQGKVISDKIDILTGDVNTHKSGIASTTELGHVMVDGTTITIDTDGKISSSGGAIPDASTSQKGIVQLSTSTTSTSSTTAATSSAINTVRGQIPSLNNTLTSTSTIQAATANVVKTVNDRLEAVRIGVSASNNNQYSVVIGREAINNSETAYTVLVGTEAKNVINKANGTGIGGRVEVGNGGTAVGLNARATGDSSVAIGISAVSLNTNEFILGTSQSAVKVAGTFSVAGAKQFEMAHPHPDKKHSHVIRHGVVESPTAGDNLYRYTVEALSDRGTVELQLPDYFLYLNKDIDVWVNGDGHFGRAFGRVENDTLYVTCELAGSYKVLVIGTRNDDHDSVQSWDIKGVEREVGESWLGETYVFEDDEIIAEEEYLTEVVS